MICDATSQRCHRLISLRSNPVANPAPIPSNPRAIYNGAVTAQETERSQLLHRRRWQLGDWYISTPHTPRTDHAAAATGRISPFSTAAPTTRIAALHGAPARSTSASPATATVPDSGLPRCHTSVLSAGVAGQPANQTRCFAEATRPPPPYLTPRHHVTWRCDPGRCARRAVARPVRPNRQKGEVMQPKTGYD